MPVSLFERLVSFISYITAGWGGMIVMVIMYFRKKYPSRFLRYNVFQSIFISLLFFVLSLGCGLILKILSIIPFLNYLISTIVLQFTRPVLFDYSLIQLFVTGLVLYMAFSSLFGRYPRVYWVSKIIDSQVR